MRLASIPFVFLYLLLIAMSEGESSEVNAEKAVEAPRKIEVNGNKVNLDHMGPMIINPDGTVRRIANWDSMTEQEKAVAWKRISARNQARIQELKANGIELKTDNKDDDSDSNQPHLAIADVSEES